MMRVQCVVCLSATATMQTFPCAHRVTCRRCFVRTIQTAISDRNLPLRCVVCRARILTLNEPPAYIDDHTEPLQGTAATTPADWIVPEEDGFPESDSRVPDRPASAKVVDGQQQLGLKEIYLSRRRQKQSVDDPGSLAGK